MNTFFTADTHLGHEKIMEHCNRPFKTVNHMDDFIINSWLKQVKSQDTVYILGDFAWKKWYYLEILPILPGNIIFIAGNHDYKMVKEEVRKIKLLDIKINGRHITLCHYPMITWYQRRRHAYHFHGHCHGSLEYKESRRVDVGVDCWNFKLAEYGEIINKIQKELMYESISNYDLY